MERILSLEVGGGLSVRLGSESGGTRLFDRARCGVVHEKGILLPFAACATIAGVFWDIGSHIGWYSCVAAVVNPQIEIVMVDPNGICLNVAARNLELNGGRARAAVNAAIGGEDCLAWLASQDRGESMTGCTRRWRSATSVGAPVAQITVDRLLREGSPTPDLVKVDVEGAELNVLEGMRKLLRRRSPVLIIELHGKLLEEQGQTTEDVARLLHSYGYLLSCWDKDAGLVRVLPTRGTPGCEDVLLCWPPVNSALGRPFAVDATSGRHSRARRREVEGCRCSSTRRYTHIRLRPSSPSSS